MLYYLTRSTVANLTKSIRVNNPANLRYTGTPWNGLTGYWVGSGGRRFCTFDTALHGLTAAAQNVIYVIRTLGENTYDSFGEAWCPAGDNNGASDYGEKLAAQLGKKPSDLVVYNSIALAQLLRAIVKNENTVNPYSDTLYLQAATAGLKAKGLL